MRILSWNIQSGLGCDGRRDLKRIVNHIIGFGNRPEVICLQEVARYFPDCVTAGQEDQLRTLAALLPDYQSLWASGMCWHRENGPPQEFGNLTLARSQVLDSRVHCLPAPAAAGRLQMARCCIETVIDAEPAPIRIFNTHLAYHSAEERLLQVSYFCDRLKWLLAAIADPPLTGYGPYQNRYATPDCMLCGDLNFVPFGPEYQLLKQAGWIDAIPSTRGNCGHLPTCGIHDRKTWPEGPHCRDYFWLAPGLAETELRLQVDTDCTFSDHQPLVLELTPGVEHG